MFPSVQGAKGVVLAHRCGMRRDPAPTDQSTASYNPTSMGCDCLHISTGTWHKYCADTHAGKTLITLNT